MKIREINIQNVRGLADWTLSEPITKNKPHILVAPNGFGKTSIARAFRSIAGQTSLKLKDSDRHQHDESKRARLSLVYDSGDSQSTMQVTEEARSNEIRKCFDILVVSDLREVKASAKNMGPFSAAKGKQIIPPLEICPVIPKPQCPYSISTAKSRFGEKSNLLQNLKSGVLDSEVFKLRAVELPGLLDRLTMVRLWGQLEAIREIMQQDQTWNTEFERSVLEEIEKLRSQNLDFAEAMKFLEETAALDGVQGYLALWQLSDLFKYNSDKLKAYLEWLRYQAIKESIKKGAGALSRAWKQVAVNERKGTLVLTLPEPEHISNGQRDVLVLFALLSIARYQLNKERAIIIVDEVFDYLDDANLTVAQYYLTQLVEEFKNAGKELYLLILTHLNPSFFKNYSFSNQKVIYLSDTTSMAPVDAMKKLIGSRKGNSQDHLQKKISRHLVHYHKDEIDLSSELAAISGCRPSWGKPGRFDDFLKEEFERFKNGEDCDPLAICAITRRSIERRAYEQISKHVDSETFFGVHKTSPKLDWAAQRGASIPEFHYLLRIIFDDGLHWNESRDNLVPITAKLTNPIIREMIIEAVGEI